MSQRRRKQGRNIHGILLLDKGLGVSSNRALQEVKRLFNANKAGHTGSLDPLASGLLPICFGEATKVSAYMLEDDKCYQVVIQLGVVTDTGDAEGKVLAAKSVPQISDDQIAACLNHFKGEIDQVPPMYSALKHQGKKLYELARQGKTVARKARQIHLYELQCLQFSGDRLHLHVHCSKGTYIRTLAEDIGEYLGCGGSVLELRRTAVGAFKLPAAHTLAQLQTMDYNALNDCLIAVDQPLLSIPDVKLSAQQAASIRQGQQLAVDISMSGIVRMYNGQHFLGLGEMRLDGTLAPKKLFNLA